MTQITTIRVTEHSYAQGWLTDERWNDGPPQEELTPAQIRLRAILGKEAAE